MTDIINTDPELNPFTTHLFERGVVRALKIHRDPDTYEIVEYEDVGELDEAHVISVYAYRTPELIDAGALPSIWLADFDPGMAWAIPGFVDGLGLLVHYEFTPPGPANFCDSVTKENGND